MGVNLEKKGLLFSEMMCSTGWVERGAVAETVTVGRYAALNHAKPRKTAVIGGRTHLDTLADILFAHRANPC